MTLQKEMIQRDVTPNSGGNFGSVRELYRVTDPAGVGITIEQAVTATNWPDNIYPFARNTQNTTDNAFYVVSTSLSQPAPTIVDIAVEYTDKASSIGKSSTSPQQADRSQPGFCSITTRFYPAFVDVWKRASAAAPITASTISGDPYAVADIGGDSVGVGNVDMAGSPISMPVLQAEVSVSLTRGNSEPIPWLNIRTMTGSRLLLATGYLGFSTGTLLLAGARVTETFAESASVSYEINFQYSSIGHLRQIIGAMDANGLPVLSVDAAGNYHAADVFVLQPFPSVAVSTGGTGSSSLMSAQEYALLNGIM